MNKSVVFIGIFFSFLIAKNPGDSLVWNAVHNFYNYETETAISILDSARISFPENPKVYFTWVAAKMLHGEANYSTKKTYTILSNSLSEIIPVLQSLKKQYPNDPEIKLYLGCAVGLKARVSLGRKQWISTLINAYKGFRMIREVALKNPELIDAQLPIGIVEYYASLNPGLIRFGAKLMGINAHRNSGLAKIKNAALNGDFSKIEAKKIHAFLCLWVEDDPESALTPSRELREEFPQNLFFGIMYLESLIRMKKYTEAKKLMDLLNVELELLTSIQQEWYKSYLLYELAVYQFLHGEFSEALINVEKAIHNYKAELDIILGNAILLKGIINDIIGNREIALRAYEKVIKLDNNSSAIKKAEKFKNSPFTN